MFEFKKTYQLPFKYQVQTNSHTYINQNSFIKRYLKYLKRYLFIKFLGQNSLERKVITSEHRRILWINLSATSIGDSLMDLSSRVLLKGKNVDLYTNVAVSDIFLTDKIFSNIFSSKKSIDCKKYDLVIIDSYSTRTIRVKSKIAKTIPFVGMYGFYNGPDVNRTMFSFHRLNQLLGYMHSENRINEISKLSLTISFKDKKIVKTFNLPKNYILVALGGEWSFRTYNKWAELIQVLLKNDKNINIVLVGSANGESSAKIIMNKFYNANILNYVSKLTFVQTAYIIQHGKILFCCDGGLMHSASAVNTCFIPLFAAVESDMRITKSDNAFPLFDKNDVNNIEIDDIFKKYLEAKMLLKHK